MKKHRRIISLILSLIIAATAVICVSASSEAHINSGEEFTGLMPLDKKVNYSNDLPVPYALLPENYSAADEGLTLPVRQQHASTCWAFGTLSSFETLLLKNGESPNTFAPQHTNYWGTPREDGSGWQRTSSSGGYSYIPLGYLTSWEGPLYEAEFPEEESTMEDFISTDATPRYGLTEAIYFNSDAHPDSIKNLILNYGSVVCNFNADLKYLSNRTSFYCSDSTLGIGQLSGHCVSVVGWDDNYPKENFANSASGTPEHDGAWLMKNSWSQFYNNLDGYFWISYEDVWVFDEIFGPSYALTKYEKLNPGLHLYQNETGGATYEFNYIGKKNCVTYMNVFDFDENHRNLDKVIFECTALGAEYTIYYIPFINDAPDKKFSHWTELYEGCVDYTGYICADVEDITVPKGKGCIGVTIDTEVVNDGASTITYNSIGVCEWLTTGGKMIYIPQAKDGLSYYMDMNKYNAPVVDVMDLYRDSLGDDVGGTFVIKAITRNEYTEPVTTIPTTIPTTETSVSTTVTTAPTENTTPSTTADTKPTGTSTTEPSAVTNPTDTTGNTDITGNTDPTETTTSPVTMIPYLLGDADLNDKVNIKDATYIQKYAADIVTLNDIEFLAADVNGTNSVNVTDATALQKFLAEIPVKFEINTERFYYKSE